MTPEHRADLKRHLAADYGDEFLFGYAESSIGELEVRIFGAQERIENLRELFALRREVRAERQAAAS
jgi:hypothetical protein